MAYNGSSAMDAHKYYGGSGTFADRRKTWVDLGLGDAASYQGTAAQNGQLISAMNSYGGLTRPVTQTPAAQTATPAPVSNTTSSPAAGSAPSSSSGQSSVAALRSNSDALQQQLAALVGGEGGALGSYDDSAVQKIYDSYLAQRNANPYDNTALQKIYDSYLAQRNALGPFQYNYAADPAYQAYAEQYGRAGRRAMEDTLAQVSARTGGLASSYAGAAAQQQYDRYMTELNNVIPQLEQIAYSRYRDARSDLDKDLSTQLALENTLYGRDRDRLSDLDTDLSRQLALEGLAYDRYRDTVGDEQWNKTFDYNVVQDMLAQSNWERNFASQEEQRLFENTITQKKLDYNIKTDQQNLLVELMTKTGYVPTDAELAATGLTRPQADSFRLVYQLAQVAASSSGSGGGGGGSEYRTKPASEKTVETITNTVKNINSDKEKREYVEKQVEEKKITPDQAVEIIRSVNPVLLNPAPNKVLQTKPNGASGGTKLGKNPMTK